MCDFFKYFIFVLIWGFIAVPLSMRSDDLCTTFDGSEFVIKKWKGVDKDDKCNEQHFVIMTCSYKNKDWYERNLESIFKQNYRNYSLVYVDDCSPDETGELVEQYIIDRKPACDVTLIRNKKRVTALLNLYRIIHMSDPSDVLITLDGDDWFPDEAVLSRLNLIYKDKNVWLTYGQFKTYPSGSIGFCAPYPEHIIQRNAYREWSHQPSHLRTFYAWLVQQIKLEDMLYEGCFYSMTYDLALTMPMMEMAGARHKFVSDIMCIYNDATPISDHKTIFGLQHALAKIIRSKKRYELLDRSLVDYRESFKNEKADVIIYSHENPYKLSILLDSVKKYVSGLGSCFVLYIADTQQTTVEYENLGEQLAPFVQFIKLDKQIFKTEPNFGLLNGVLTSKYILFIDDDIVVNRPVNLNSCICALEQTKAYAFFLESEENVLRINKNHTPGTPIMNLGTHIFINSDENILAWQSKHIGFLKQINNNGMSIYRKEDFCGSSYAQAGDCGKCLIQNRIGLCYEQPACCKA